MTENFTHLHVHSEFSILDGKSRVTELAAAAARMGQKSVALTDHGSTSGHYDFWRSCVDHGVSPILGTELYFAPEGRAERRSLNWGLLEDKPAPGRYTHLTAWALGDVGLRNLYRLQHRGYAEGFYYKPRVDLGLLGEHADGVAVSTGCMGSETSTLLRLGRMGDAVQAAGRLSDIYPGRCFVELMYHGIDGEDALVRDQIEMSKRVGLPLVATNDSHYTNSSEAEVHDALLAIQTRAKLADEKRFRFNGSGFHLRSRAEMEALGLPAEAIRNTLLVAERVDSSSYEAVFAGRDLSPKWPGDAAQSLSERAWLECPPWDEYESRLEYELSTIISCGFADYFLVLTDFFDICREEGVRVGPGRGSAGGSLVAFLLGITQLDPIRHGLLFERFLNPQRVSPPDIDVDVDDRYREKVLGKLRERWGDDRVAHVSTLGTIGAKAALKDSARVLGKGYGTGEQMVRELPPAVRGRAPTLADYPGDPGPNSDVLELARGLEGLVRSTGQHASAVIISPEPLQDLVPLWQDTKTKRWVTGFTAGPLEAMGFVKYDFLGLKNLGIIDECLRRVQLRKHPAGTDALGGVPAESRADLPTDFDDTRTYDLLSAGDTLGVFQLESPGMRGLLRRLRPGELGDLAAVLALYRPGPMDRGSHTEYALRKTGSHAVEYPHPEFAGSLSGVLGPTYGLIVYQEQVMQILNIICGWDYGEAELVFNALRKKDRDKLARAKPRYLEAGLGLGYSADALGALWDLLLPFADYSFNKAHATGYAYVSYWTAFLKANHTAEYLASLLDAEGDPQKVTEYVREAQRLGVSVDGPSIFESDINWTVTDGGGIRRGLAHVRGIGPRVAAHILASRPYRDLNDFLGRVHVDVLRANVLNSLAEAGAVGDEATCDYVLSDQSLASKAVEKRAAAASGATGLWAHLPLVPIRIGTGDAAGYDHGRFRLTRPLTGSEWHFVVAACRLYPGDRRLELAYGNFVVRVPLRVSETPRELEALGLIEEDT